jgi:D-alanyl-D-alanine carboxypeptidase
VRVESRDIAHGYEVIGGRVQDLTDIDSSMAGAAGAHALLTTTADLSRFLRGLLAGKLFQRPETLAQMRAFVTTPNDNGRVGYGLGLERYVLPGNVEMVGHVGTTGGYRAFMFHLPAQGIDLAMVTTAPTDPMPVLVPALKVLLAEAS